MTDEPAAPTPEYEATLTSLADPADAPAEAVDTGPVLTGCVDMDALHAAAAAEHAAAAKNQKTAAKPVITNLDE